MCVGGAEKEQFAGAKTSADSKKERIDIEGLFFTPSIADFLDHIGIGKRQGYGVGAGNLCNGAAEAIGDFRLEDLFRFIPGVALDFRHRFCCGNGLGGRRFGGIPGWLGRRCGCFGRSRSGRLLGLLLGVFGRRLVTGKGIGRGKFFLSNPKRFF